MKKVLSAAIIAIVLTTACKKSNNEDKAYEVNSATSVAEWNGNARDHGHIGSFEVQGTLTAGSGGTVKEGSFTIPIASIKDFDLPDPTREVLLNDLRDNFFKLATYPNAKFTITKIAAYTGKDTGIVAGANTLVTGDFTMLGQTHPISFPAKIISTDSMRVEAKFKLDRTKWGMNNYTDESQQLYIYPNINMHLKVQAAKK